MKTGIIISAAIGAALATYYFISKKLNKGQEPVHNKKNHHLTNVFAKAKDFSLAN